MLMKNIRLQLELPEQRVEELRRLMDQCSITTQKELLNAALTLFEWAVDEARGGRRIASFDDQTSSYREIAMPALSNARRWSLAVASPAASPANRTGVKHAKAG